jgi:hypothetical protein
MVVAAVVVMAAVGVQFEFFVLGQVKVKCYEVPAI